MMTSLADKTALITGASRGMGRATALALAAAGARVIVHFGRNADEAKTVVDRIRAAGGRADAVSADLAAPDGAHALAAQVRNLIGDRLDIFVSIGSRGIRVNAVAPGVIDTDMSNFTKTEEGRATVMGMQTLKPIGQPDDVASVIAFLVSDEARWITGDTIAVDGGSRL